MSLDLPFSRRHLAIALVAVALGCAAGVCYWQLGESPEPLSESENREGSPQTQAHQPTNTSVQNSSPTPIASQPLPNDANLKDWPTEQVVQRMDAILKQVGEKIVAGQPVGGNDVPSFVSKSPEVLTFIPHDLDIVFQDDALTVWRGRDGPGSTEKKPTDNADPQFAAAINTIWSPFSNIDNASCKFKTFEISSSGGHWRTRHFFSCSATTKEGLIEQHATLSISWTTDDLRIDSVNVTDFERVLARESTQTLLQDCTASVLGGNECYRSQLLRGYNHWLRRMESPPYLYNMSTPAVAIADVNGDGLSDLYLAQEQGLPNRLFVQQADGSARDESAQWGVDWLEDSRGALLVDFDNDGDQDLAVAVIGGVVLAENWKLKRFIVRDVLSTSDDLMSLAAVDYDRDGRLDLYVCAYNPTLSGMNDGPGGLATAGARFVYHDANDGGANHLFRNAQTSDGYWRFEDVTQSAGLDENNQRYSFAASWEDYDNDGDLDLYVANDFGRDNLYRNEGGRFTDIAEEAGAEDSGSGMAITWGDYNRDGWMDAYVSNMFSAAGRRVAAQSSFMPDAPQQVRRRLERFARGNTLLKNDGNGSFVDRSSVEGVEIGRWAWSSNFCDLNNDGWEDLLVANGFITTGNPDDL